ncbi:uncharacterized protein LOC133295163 [Gastrolobium bilobum]|uniref:uncharacterized protein LOC133295163 n=1 Tax=Gastrolobium bilobum TaxID=150636 RepID=UPI002AB0F32B|nr:uncharacterized protein LOC133295163 [Gastrolobium bilobum]
MIQGLTKNGSSDFLLPGDNYPHWLAYKDEGHSVLFQVPEDGDCRMKGMALSVVYSSTPENMGTECLVSVLIINYTKCTIVIYKRDTVMSFNDEDWQGVLSNLGPGDNVKIFVAFGHGLTVRETAVYLIYGQSITVEIEPSINVEIEPSINVKIEPSPELNIQPSPNMKMETSPKTNKSFFTVLTKKMGECLCMNQN